MNWRCCRPLLKNLDLDSADSLYHYWQETRPDCATKFAHLNAIVLVAGIEPADRLRPKPKGVLAWLLTW